MESSSSGSSSERGARRGVVYVGHIPHGFYEEEMRSYFSQFGTVIRLRHVRSRKSGRSCGYGFVEFACEEVARIVADTMHNYLMHNKLLKCQFLAPGSVHRGMLVRGRRRREHSLETRNKAAQRLHNQGRSAAQFVRCVRRARARERKKEGRLKELGVDYQLPARTGVGEPKHTHFTSN